MEKINNYIAMTLQAFLSLTFISLIGYTLFINNKASFFLYLPIFVQAVLFLIISYLLFKIPEINKGIENKILHFIFLLLTLDGIKILPTMQKEAGFYLLSSSSIGYIHLFSALTIGFLFILSGILKTEINTKKYRHYLLFFVTFSLLIVSLQRIQNPSIDDVNLPLHPTTGFTIMFILIQISAIFSHIPNYIHDRSKHNRTKTIAFIMMIIASAFLLYQIELPFYFTLFNSILLIFSEVLYIINIQSYTI